MVKLMKNLLCMYLTMEFPERKDFSVLNGIGYSCAYSLFPLCPCILALWGYSIMKQTFKRCSMNFNLCTLNTPNILVTRFQYIFKIL